MAASTLVTSACRDCSSDSAVPGLRLVAKGAMHCAAHCQAPVKPPSAQAGSRDAPKPACLRLFPHSPCTFLSGRATK